MLKLILLLLWVDWGPIYPKMSGAKFSDPMTALYGALFDIGAHWTESMSIAPQIVDGF